MVYNTQAQGTSTVPLFLLTGRIGDFQHMIRHDTSNDKIAKIIINWCKENGFAYSFDTKNKERNFYTYPFTIDASLQRRDELMELIGAR